MTAQAQGFTNLRETARDVLIRRSLAGGAQDIHAAAREIRDRIPAGREPQVLDELLAFYCQAQIPVLKDAIAEAREARDAEIARAAQIRAAEQERKRREDEARAAQASRSEGRGFVDLRDAQKGAVPVPPVAPAAAPAASEGATTIAGSLPVPAAVPLVTSPAAPAITGPASTPTGAPPEQPGNTSGDVLTGTVVEQCAATGLAKSACGCRKCRPAPVPDWSEVITSVYARNPAVYVQPAALRAEVARALDRPEDDREVRVQVIQWARSQRAPLVPKPEGFRVRSRVAGAREALYPELYAPVGVGGIHKIVGKASAADCYAVARAYGAQGRRKIAEGSERILAGHDDLSFEAKYQALGDLVSQRGVAAVEALPDEDLAPFFMRRDAA